MLTAEQIQEIRDAVAPKPSAQYAIWGLGALLGVCMALATFELSRVSTGVERVEQRQLTQMLPGLSRVEERLRTLDRFCCSEVYGDGKVHADVMIDDDPPKKVK